jgi:hypothetical protein
MATEVINVFDKGFATIKDDQGRPSKVNVFVFRTVTNEAAPEDILAFCHPVYKDSIMKSLSRLMWVKPQQPAVPVPLTPTAEEKILDENPGAENNYDL